MDSVVKFRHELLTRMCDELQEGCSEEDIKKADALIKQAKEAFEA